MSTSAIVSDNFREDFEPYNKIHESLIGLLQKFTDDVSKLNRDIHTAHLLLSTESTDITTAVQKKKAFEQLNTELPGLTKKYNEIHDGIIVNNDKLEQLKVRIEAAIAAKQVAAEKDNDEARAVVQGQIKELEKVMNTRKSVFEKELRLKNEYVELMVDTIIPKKVDEIRQLLLQGEHISQTTKDMVKGIEPDITDFKNKLDFKNITDIFEGRHKEELKAIKDQIDTLTGAILGGNIKYMRQTLASPPLPLSTTLWDFISAADKFIGTLNAKLVELDGAEKRVKAAIEVDKNIAELLEHATEVYNSEKLFVIKLNEAGEIVVTSQSSNVLLGALLGKAITTLEPFGREVEKINNRFKQMDATMNASYKSSDNYLALETTIVRLNNLYNDQQIKYNALHDNYTKYTPAVATPPFKLPTSTDPHRRPASAKAAASASLPTFQRSSLSADAASGGPPRQAFIDAQFEPIPYTPSQYEEDDFRRTADVKSEPVTPPAPITGARRNLLYVSHNTKPPTAYLVVVKNPPLDEQPDIGGGNKTHRIQKGGAVPDSLPADSEIFPIDVDSMGFIDVMAGLLPPSVLLTVNPDGTGENPIITNIRRGRRPKEGLDALYKQIKSELITDENQNPITIGLRAVYYQNIIKLIRLLDFNLNPGKGTHENMYKKLRKFTDYKDGTFGVLDALYKDTFHPASPPASPPPASPPASPRASPGLSPRLPSLSKIDSVLKKIKGIDAKEEIKKIVGWTGPGEIKTENINFDRLKKMFSKPCPTGPNTFLSDEKKLGSSESSYHNFRLNWIILLAFHSYCNKQSTLVTVGRLITALYNAFLGWLATLSYKDTFTQLFSNTLQDPIKTYSGIVDRQLNAAIEPNSSYKDVSKLVANINEKMCILQDNSNPVIDVEHGREYNDDDPENDPDYVPSEGGDSDSSEGGTSEAAARVEEANEELGDLSPSGVQDGKSRRGHRTGPKTPDGLRTFVPDPLGDPQHDDGQSDIEMNADAPSIPVLELPIGDQVPGGPKSGERMRIELLNRVMREERMPGGPFRPSGRPSSSPPPPQPSSVPPGRVPPGSVTDRQLLRHSLVGRFHTDATTVTKLGQVPPMTEEALLARQQQQQTSQPFFIRTQSVPRSINAEPSVARQPPHPTPAPILAPAWKANPPATTNTGFGRSASSTRRISGHTGTGGSNKKRTRKHKKHTSISASRRPTRRRRRIPPTEGHKYTRKHPRT